MKRLNHPALSLGLALGLALAGGARADSGEETKTQRKIETKRVERVQTRRAAERQPGERRRVTVIDADGKDRLIHLDGPLMRRGFLGVVLTDLTPELRTHFGVPDDAGSMVAKVEPGSPAEKAGVKVGDILTSVGGEEIKGSWDVHRAIRKQEDGSQVQLEVWRNGRVQNLTATIEQRERAEIDMAPFFSREGENGDRLMFRLDKDKLLKGLPEGVEVLPPPGGWKEGEGPRAWAYRLGSPREAELEKRLKELEKRLKELEKQLEKQK